MNLFAYGTLMWPEVLEAVIGRRLFGAPATVDGYLRQRVKGELYPVLVASNPCDKVEGILYRDLSEKDFQRLDRFEGVEYDRQKVRIGMVHAEVYVLSNSWRHIASAEIWHPEDMQKEDLEAFCSEYKGWQIG